MRFKAALLDLDGTLFDTIPDLASAGNAMRRALGMQELPVDQIARYVGKGTPNLVRRLLAHDGVPFGEEQFQEALARFHAEYHLCNGKASRLYPDALAGLRLFRERGIKLAVVTNKPVEFTMPLLKLHDLLPYFEHVVGGDTCPRKKPDPMPMLHACELLGVAPEATLAVGDSINDALAARAAGITVLAVPYGYNEGMDVQNLDVDDIVASILDAAHWAQRQPQRTDS